MKYLIVSFIVAILVGIFAVQNSMVVPLSFLVWSFEMSLVIVILISAAFGALVVLPPAILGQYRLKRAANKAQQAYQLLESEYQALKEQKEQIQAKTNVKDFKNLPAGEEKEPIAGG